MVRHVAIDRNREDFETNFLEMARHVAIDRNSEDFDIKSRNHVVNTVNTVISIYRISIL